MSDLIYVDFEFSEIVEEKLNLVCCVTLDPKEGEPYRWWLHNDPVAKANLVVFLKRAKTIVAYSAIAEARSFLALGLDPLKFEWVDLFLEYRMMTNHNDDLQWGKQLVDGKVKTVQKPRPKWERTEDDKGTGFKATHSLAEATYKLTGKIRDTEHKKAMRDLIISNPDKYSYDDRISIMHYCEEDVISLPEIASKLGNEFFRLVPYGSEDQYKEEAKWRGRYAAHTAIMENRGYHINVEATKNFSSQVGNIVYDVQREINELFPDIKPFRWNKKEQRFSEDQKAIKTWVAANHDVTRWMKTDSDQISLSLDAWTRFYDYKHEYPTDVFGAQMVRYLKLKQSLYGFSQTKTGKGKNFWDSVGSDGMVRPYMNIYGAQSSRSQPAASGFMFLKPAWMRALVQPPPGKFMAGIDYASQEYFASALLSRDQNMIDAYLSGDPYLYQGKLAGAIPPEGTKETHKAMRDLFKATTLGINFLMSKYGLAAKLTADTGRVWTEDEAQEQIDTYYEAFPDLKEYQERVIEDYAADRFIRLQDGWYMFGDNDNHRSVANVPVQGTGACAMRAAVDYAVQLKVDVVFTLHDAIYMIGDVGEEHKIIDLARAMLHGFAMQFPHEQRTTAIKIRLDPFAWSPDYAPNSEMLVLPKGRGPKMIVPTSNLYIDDRAKKDYDKFSEYFQPRIEDEL